MPIKPSSASISRTKWPLPRPPIAGLHDIAPMVANRWVTSAVRAPIRAAAAAASQPACPPPITITSKLVMGRSGSVSIRPVAFGQALQDRSGVADDSSRLRIEVWNACAALFHVKHRPFPLSRYLFSNTEVSKDHVENILHVDPASQPPQRSRGQTK